jgi:hypothetical protein
VSFIKHNPIPIHPVKNAVVILLRITFSLVKVVMALLLPKNINIAKKWSANAKHIQFCMQLRGHHRLLKRHHVEPSA